MSWDNRTADLGSMQKANFWLTVTPESPHPPGWLHGPQAGGTRVRNHNNMIKNLQSPLSSISLRFSFCKITKYI